MQFVYEEFQYCVGYVICEVYLREVNKLCSQPIGDNKRKPHNVSAEEKRQMRAEEGAVGN